MRSSGFGVKAFRALRWVFMLVAKSVHRFQALFRAPQELEQGLGAVVVQLQ